jgi:hypothetical protein
MRLIPPDIWAMAVALGKLRQAMDETPSVRTFQACLDIHKRLNWRLDDMRKMTKLCPSSNIEIYRPNFR